MHTVEPSANHFCNSNVDANFQAHSLLLFPSKTIHTDGIRAGVMVSTTYISNNFNYLTSP